MAIRQEGPCNLPPMFHRYVLWTVPVLSKGQSRNQSQGHITPAMFFLCWNFPIPIQTFKILDKDKSLWLHFYLQPLPCFFLSCHPSHLLLSRWPRVDTVLDSVVSFQSAPCPPLLVTHGLHEVWGCFHTALS